jgi:hypothetical protein
VRVPVVSPARSRAAEGDGRTSSGRPRSNGQVVAASLTAAFNVLSERDGDTKEKSRSAADLAAAIDPVITFLRGGLDALKDPPATRRR